MNANRPIGVLVVVALSIVVGRAAAQDESRTGEDDPIQSRIETTDHGYTLAQEVLIAAPIDDVWAAFVTDEGWTAWASPVAKIDLRPGGTIQTHYDLEAEIGDEGTNVLDVVNFVPRRVLTLKARESAAWPEAMRRDAAHLMNVIVFNDLGEAGTRVESYGVGYGEDPAYDRMLKFFDQANRGLYLKLIAYLEKGERTKF